jgi:hypothetical protein
MWWTRVARAMALYSVLGTCRLNHWIPPKPNFFYSDLMGFYGGLMGFYSDLMGFYGDLMGFLMGSMEFDGDLITRG